MGCDGNEVKAEQELEVDGARCTCLCLGGKLVQTGPLESKAGAPELCQGPRCPVWLCLSFPINVAVSIRGLGQE